jgi:hypothetical protein
MKFQLVICTVLGALLLSSSSFAKSAEQLNCLVEHMGEDEFVGFAELVTIKDEAHRTKKAPDYIRIGMRMSACARKYDWSDNERKNSIGYAMAYPLSRGLRLLGETAEYAALDRYFAANPRAYARDGSFDPKTLEPMIEAAVADGLKLDGSIEARRNAAQYLDSLYVIASYRRNFEANSFKMPKRD